MPFFYAAMTARAKGIDDEDGYDYIFVVDFVFTLSKVKAIEKLERKMQMELAPKFPDVTFDSGVVEKSSVVRWIAHKLDVKGSK